MKMMRGEVSAKTTYQKSSTGPVSIADVSPEGKYITLENTSSQRRVGQNIELVWHSNNKSLKTPKGGN